MTVLADHSLQSRAPDGATAEEIRLRPATPADASLVFGWRNLPAIVALGSLRREVTWEEHFAWFTESVQQSRRSLFIIEVDATPAGQLRVDWLENGSGEISLYLLPAYTGRGLGVQAIRQGCRRVNASERNGPIIAWVRSTNERSLVAFGKAGFARDNHGPQREEHLRMVLCPLPRVPHNRLTFGVEEERAVARVVRSGRWAGGPILAELEDRLARTAGVASGIGVGSGLAALRLSLLAIGVRANDAVAVPAYSCVALANAVLACGAKPVPIAVEAGTWNISVSALRQTLAARPDIAAVIAVHTFGCPAPLQAIADLGVPVIEDCSHAFGRDSFGSQGTLAILSLYATKLLGAGEGGMVLTDNAALAAKVRALRDYADQPATALRLNDKLSDLTAALALAQLDRLPELLVRRTTIAERYTRLLAAAAGRGSFHLPDFTAGRVWYRYTVAVHDAARVIARLHAWGIDAARPVEDWCEPGAADTTVSQEAHRQLVSLPLYPTLTEVEQDRVVAAFLAAVAE